ncbi:MAG: 3'-5' exonuclease, partial [Pyrinomonadaceae bacterium]
LEQNYRSTQTILDAAGAVVQNNKNRKGKKLWTSNPTGELVRYFQALDADMEARFIISQIQEHRMRDLDVRAAILYRTNAQSRLFEETLRRNGVPYNIVGGFSFYERAEIRDIIAYLKLALNPDDSIALSRIINSPARGIGKQTLEEIERSAQELNTSYWKVIEQIVETKNNPSRQNSVISSESLSFNLSARAVFSLEGFYNIINQLRMLIAADHDKPVSEAVKAAIIDTGYELALKEAGSEEATAKIENLQELVNAAEEYDTRDEGGHEGGHEGDQQGEQSRQDGLRDFIDAAALVSDTDQYKRDAPVTLLTMHSAKGLEFPLVFIVGMEDGLFPHARSANDNAEMEEERRLCYVAMTRAQKYLYVTHAMRRRVYGKEVASEPSQFLNELPIEIIKDLSSGSSWLSPARSFPVELRVEQRVEPYRKYSGSNFSGRTYNDLEAITEFLKERKQKGQHNTTQTSQKNSTSEFIPGSYVRHAKYGRGLVLRREGSSDSCKLTIVFPGYGQKKLMEKFAGLVRD